MTPELKEKWATALESGKYKQGSGRLKNPNDAFCCLGVLCDIQGCEWVAGEPYLKWVAGEPYLGEGRIGTTYLLSSSYIKAIGLTWEDMKRLAGMNDNYNSFKTIAEQIRILPD